MRHILFLILFTLHKNHSPGFKNLSKLRHAWCARPVGLCPVVYRFSTEDSESLPCSLQINLCALWWNNEDSQYNPGWGWPCRGRDLDWKDLFVAPSLHSPCWSPCHHICVAHVVERLNPVWLKDVNKRWFQSLDSHIIPLIQHCLLRYIVLLCSILRPPAHPHLRATEEKSCFLPGSNLSLEWFLQYELPYGRFN